MGKKAKGSSPKKNETVVDTEVVQKVTDLKNEGNKLFAKKEYVKAIEQYEQASKLLPEGAADKADLLCNKAACYYQMKRYKDATKECTNALTLAPSSSKALTRRARSYEQQGLFKQALSDIQAVNKTEAASDESRDFEKRLKDVLAGRRPSLANGGAAARAAPATRAPRSLAYYFSAKCSLGNETRMVHMSANNSYADLLASVRQKFPEAGPFMLKYLDKDGDLVTMTSRSDVQNALAEVVALINPKALPNVQVPPIRVQLVPVQSEADIPSPPIEEVLEREQLIAQQRAAAAKAAAAARRDAPEPSPITAATPSGEVVEIDEWLVDFANLFREMSGIDPDRHIDFHNEGWDTCSKAMEATLRCDAALPLFDRAAERFKEVACTGLLNWGNVHVCIAHKHLDEAAAANTPLSEVADVVNKEFDAAEVRYKEALAYKPDFFDGLCAMGQLEFERAKLKAGLAVKPVRPPSVEEDMDPKAAEKLQQAAATAAADALKEALTKVSADDVSAAQPHIDTAFDWFHQAVEQAKQVDEKKKQEKEDKEKEEKDKAAANSAAQPNGAAAKTTAPSPPPAAEPEISLAGQAQIMHGNIMYEWSQILAAVGKEWRPVLDEAVSRFRSAGCNESDIRNALKNHTKVDDLELGPEPELEQAVDKAEPQRSSIKDTKQPAPEAKGLPSLEPHKGKKKAATQAAASAPTAAAAATS